MGINIYSWLSLYQPRLSRITAYLEVKIWSLPKHENLTTDKKHCGKEEKLLLSNFSSFPQYFQYISNFRSQITYTVVKYGCSIHFFPANLICRGTDISKYFRESLEIRDNESRLVYVYKKTTFNFLLFFCFLVPLVRNEYILRNEYIWSQPR